MGISTSLGGGRGRVSASRAHTPSTAMPTQEWPVYSHESDHKGCAQTITASSDSRLKASVEQLRVIADLEQLIANQALTDMPTRQRWKLAGVGQERPVTTRRVAPELARGSINKRAIKNRLMECQEPVCVSGPQKPQNQWLN